MLSGRRLPQLLCQIRRSRMEVPLEHAQILVPHDCSQLDEVGSPLGKPRRGLVPAPAAGVTPARQAVGLDLSL
jgi:hypothetical protein